MLIVIKNYIVFKGVQNKANTSETLSSLYIKTIINILKQTKITLDFKRFLSKFRLKIPGKSQFLVFQKSLSSHSTGTFKFTYFSSILTSFSANFIILLINICAYLLISSCITTQYNNL